MASSRVRAIARLFRIAVHEPGERRLEALAIGAAAAAFGVVLVVGLGVFAFRDVPIAGAGSMGEFVMIAAGLTAIAAFAAGIACTWPGRGTFGWVGLVDAVALALAFAVIAVLSWALLADVLQRGFVGAELYTLPAALIGGATAALTAYLVFSGTTHLDLQLLALVLAVFLLEGVLAASLAANDPHWWEDNLSALGMVGESSAFMFNLTVIVAGVLVTALARYATADLVSTNPRGVRNVRISLILIGCALMVVGLVPVNVSFLIHTGIASGMLVVYGVLVAMLPRWLPTIGRTFVSLGWVFLAILAVLVVLFAVSYYTLTAVEMVAGILIFAWIILFIRSVAASAADEAPRSAVAAKQVGA